MFVYSIDERIFGITITGRHSLIYSSQRGSIQSIFNTEYITLKGLIDFIAAITIDGSVYLIRIFTDHGSQVTVDLIDPRICAARYCVLSQTDSVCAVIYDHCVLFHDIDGGNRDVFFEDITYGTNPFLDKVVVSSIDKCIIGIDGEWFEVRNDDIQAIAADEKYRSMIVYNDLIQLHDDGNLYIFDKLKSEKFILLDTNVSETSFVKEYNYSRPSISYGPVCLINNNMYLESSYGNRLLLSRDVDSFVALSVDHFYYTSAGRLYIIRGMESEEAGAKGNIKLMTNRGYDARDISIKKVKNARKQ
jgi:hypothetical protein